MHWDAQLTWIWAHRNSPQFRNLKIRHYAQGPQSLISHIWEKCTSTRNTQTFNQLSTKGMSSGLCWWVFTSNIQIKYLNKPSFGSIPTWNNQNIPSYCRPNLNPQCTTIILWPITQKFFIHCYTWFNKMCWTTMRIYWAKTQKLKLRNSGCEHNPWSIQGSALVDTIITMTLEAI